MPPPNVAPLVDLVGFLIGASLYAMLFGLVGRKKNGGDLLPFITAILGLLWNVIGLAAYGIRDFFARDPHPLLIAVAYSALGFLPAVVVHSLFRSRAGESSAPARTLIALAYIVSSIAAALMFGSATAGIAPSPLALQTLMWSYAALTLPILWLTRRWVGSARAWSIVALAVFTVSALHLSRHAANESLVEVAGHHAPIPLIFAILYQDFRFALADLFLKRALALFSLVALASALYFGIEVPLLAQHNYRNDPVAIGVSVMLWVTLALLYPLMRRASERVVDRLVLHRPDYGVLRETIARRVASIGEPAAVLDVVADELRAPLAADDVSWSEGAGEIPITTSEPPQYALTIGELAGGRRLLSDDLHMLQQVAAIASRRIDAIRISRERKLAAEAELRALRAQLNPHFLFNALNTIGYLIHASPMRAQATLMKLTSLLRGVLHLGERSTTLGEEIDLAGAYLDIEKARFEERLDIVISVPESLRAMRVPPLIVQPLVENAVKHGIARSRAGGRIAIVARLDGDFLGISVRNTGAATESEIARGRRQGVGLANIEARLKHHHGDAARVTLASDDESTTAEVVLPIPTTARSA
jgi:hypothetical protein